MIRPNFNVANGDVGNKMLASAFDVEEVIIEHPNNRNVKTNHKFIMNKESKQIISCMTKDYKLMPNKELLAQINKPLVEADAVLTAVDMFSSARTRYTFQFPDKLFTVGTEQMLPRMIIHNSYDGSCGVNIIAGIFVLVCSNGMVVEKIVENWRNRHLEGNESLDSMDSIIEQVIKTITLDHAQQFKLLADTPIENKMHVPDTMAMFPKKNHETMMTYMKAHEINTYWDLLNLATWTSTHSLNREHESTHRIEDAIFKDINKMARA